MSVAHLVNVRWLLGSKGRRIKLLILEAALSREHSWQAFLSTGECYLDSKRHGRLRKLCVRESEWVRQ